MRSCCWFGLDDRVDEEFGEGEGKEYWSCCSGRDVGVGGYGEEDEVVVEHVEAVSWSSFFSRSWNNGKFCRWWWWWWRRK